MSKKHQYPKKYSKPDSSMNSRGVKNENLDSLEAGPSFINDKAGPSFIDDKAGPSFIDDKAGPSFKYDEAGPSFIDDDYTRTVIKGVVNNVYKNKTEIKIKRIMLENIFTDTYEKLQLINELEDECSLYRSFTTVPLPQNLASYRSLPKYPQSRSYPPNVSKPPALVIMAMGGKDALVLKLCKFKDNQKPENIVKLQVFMYKEGYVDEAGFSNDWWERMCEYKTNLLPLPRDLSFNCKVMLDVKYHFMVRAVDAHNRKGDFSNPVAAIFTRS